MSKTPAIPLAFLTASISREAGGLFNSVRRLAQTLAAGSKTGVHVLAVRDSATEADLAQWQPLAPEVFKPTGPKMLRYAPELSERLQNLNPALVRLDGLWTYPSWAALRWRRATNRPVVIAPRGMLDAWALRNSRWKKAIASAWFERENLAGAACLHALCEPELQAFRAYGLRNPVAVIPNGVDPPASIPAPLDIPGRDGRKVLLYLGRLHPKKGLGNLISGWSAVSREGKDWLLAIAGWDQGGHESELQGQATSLGLTWCSGHHGENCTRPAIVFLGPRFGPEKDAAFAAADAFVLPSFSEGLPMALLEAWAFAKPVIMTPACNLPEGFCHDAALRIETSTESIGEGLRGLFDMSAGDLAAMGGRGRALVADRFTWPRVAAEFQSVCNWLVGGGARPACVTEA